MSDDLPIIPSTTQEILLLVGSPASGKSFFFEKSEYAKYFSDYVIISKDDLGTMKNVCMELRKALKEGFSVIVSNTNALKVGKFDEKKCKGSVGRDYYVSIAKEYNVKIRAVHFKTTVETSRLLNEHRKIATGKNVPLVAIYKYFKIYRENELDLSEGYDEIIVIELEIDPDLKEILKKGLENDAEQKNKYSILNYIQVEL